MKFMLCGMSLFPLPVVQIINRAHAAGFDGVELFLLGEWDSEKVYRVMDYAENRNLTVHFHQTWSNEESDGSAVWENRILTWLGMIPRDGYKLSYMAPWNASPLVVYADRFPESRRAAWFQMISTTAPNGDYRMPYHQFKRLMMGREYPLVFDTQHILEYVNGVRGVDKLGMTTDEVLQVWSCEWRWSKEQVKEVHFNDFNPVLGQKKGRNVFPGTGKSPLIDFAKMVKDSGWEGWITPEVRPDLIRWSSKRLLALRKDMDRYF